MSNTFNVLRGRQGNTLIATVYNADGSVKSDLAHDTAGISIFVQRIGQADGSPLTPLSAKATPQTAHNPGALLNLGGGDISLDVPDDPFQNYDGLIRIYGTFTGGVIVGHWYQVVGYDAADVAVGANTTTPPTAEQNATAVAEAILETPANKLVTDAEGRVLADVDVDTEALAAEIVAAILVALGESGDVPITITASVDSLSVRGVQITLAGTNRTVTTGELGLAILNVLSTDGPYQLLITPPVGFAPIDPIDITPDPLDPQPIAVNIELVPTSIPAPDDPNLCGVAVDVVTQYGLRPEGADVWAIPADALPFAVDSLVVTDPPTYPTNNQGRAVLPLHRLLTYRIAVRYLDVVKTITYTVPDADTALATVHIPTA